MTSARTPRRRWPGLGWLGLVPALASLAAGGACAATGVESSIIVGMDATGQPVNPPANVAASTWTKANPWNGKAARANAVTRRLAFEEVREDIQGGAAARPAGAAGRHSANPLSAVVFDAVTAADPAASPIGRAR